MSKTSYKIRPLLLALLLASTGAAQAHRAWMLPSATVLSGNEPWVTVDAAVSNDLFYFEHNPLNIDRLAVQAPDGSRITPENIGKGRYRNSFDLKLAQPGTYKIALVTDMLFASYKLDGAAKRLRGSAESLAKEIPAGAQELQVTQAVNRNEIFVTAGKPSDKVLAPTGQGLELQPITHPNDLVVGEAAQFRFLLNGKPAAGLTVTVIPGGNRYRDKLGEMKLSTDADGKLSIKWEQPGMYWLNAVPSGSPERAAAAAGTLDKPQRRYGYVTTLEVLPQ